jgi:carboxymethylenebutenolidase
MMLEVDLTQLSAPLGGSVPLRGFLTRPDGDGPWPGVLMIHEIFGFDEVMQRHAARLAASGYLTLAVDLFSTGGPARCLVSTMRALIRQAGRPFSDIEAAHQWLASTPECTGSVGVVGFCMGGGFALLSARTGFDVAAVNYGQLPKELNRAVEGACPVVASYGGRDRTLRGAAPRIDEALRRAGVEHDVVEYPTAGHAFLNDTEAGPRPLRPLLRVMGIKPDPEASVDAWRRIDNYLDQHLRSRGAGPSDGLGGRPAL